MRFRYKLVATQFSQQFHVTNNLFKLFFIGFFLRQFRKKHSFLIFRLYFIVVLTEIFCKIFCAIENPTKNTKICLAKCLPYLRPFSQVCKIENISFDLHFRAKPYKNISMQFCMFFPSSPPPPPGTAFTLSINFPCHHEYVLHTKKSFSKLSL